MNFLHIERPCTICILIVAIFLLHFGDFKWLYIFVIWILIDVIFFKWIFLGLFKVVFLKLPLKFNPWYICEWLWNNHHQNMIFGSGFENPPLKYFFLNFSRWFLKITAKDTFQGDFWRTFPKTLLTMVLGGVYLA